MHLSAAIPGGLTYGDIRGHTGTYGDVRGNSAGFSYFCRQFLARDGGVRPLLHFQGKIHGERPAEICNIAAILKMKT